MVKRSGSGLDRRGFGRLVLGSMILVPVGTVQSLAAVDTTDLPPVHYGDVLTADTLNNMIDRINELSKRPARRG